MRHLCAKIISDVGRRIGIRRDYVGLSKQVRFCAVRITSPGNTKCFSKKSLEHVIHVEL